MTTDGRVLAVVVCSAGPATAIGTLIELARGWGWTVQVIATIPDPGIAEPAIRRGAAYQCRGK